VKQGLLERQSLTDEMTGLSNYRSFRGRLSLEHERAEVKSQPYCVVFFDVDHFKHFNDRNGHPAGDETLRRLAAVLRKVSTRSEFVARYGGEEFVVLVSGATLDQGRAFAELARAEVEKEDFPYGSNQPLGKVSVSVGVSVYEAGVSAEEILKRADAALYESKQKGRNRVTSYLSEKNALNYLLKKVA
jgi:diguanylate cyclase (GGDEF)-like protein